MAPPAWTGGLVFQVGRAACSKLISTMANRAAAAPTLHLARNPKGEARSKWKPRDLVMTGLLC